MAAVRILFYVLTLICVGLSGVLSYFGYLYHTGTVTPLFVGMIVIGLLMCDITLQVRRSKGQSVVLTIVVFLLLPLPLSALSNFNHLYTLFMRGDVVRETVTESIASLRRDLRESAETVRSYPPLREYESRKLRLETELEQMYLQATDPENPGCAQLCRAHKTEIESLLGNRMTPLALPSNGGGLEAFKARWDPYYENYRSNAEQTFVALYETDAVRDTRAILSDIDVTLDTYASANSIIADGQGLEALPKMSDASLDIETRVNALPGGGTVEHTLIDREAGRLGQIPLTVQNAFFEMPNPTATVLSLFFALTIDIFPLILGLGLLRQGEGVREIDEDDSPFETI